MEPPEPEPLAPEPEEPEPEPEAALGSDVVVVARFLWLFDEPGPDDDVVVCLAASGDGPVGPGVARATPPP